MKIETPVIHDTKQLLHPHVLFTVGMPRCGKTTFCNGLIESIYPNLNLVCADDIRIALTGQRYNEYTESYVSAIKYTMIRAHIQRGHNVLVDGTHTTESSIRRLLRITIHCYPIFIPCIPETEKDLDVIKRMCIERCIKTRQNDLIPVIERQHKQLTSMLPWSSFLEKIKTWAREESERPYAIHEVVK